METERAAAPLHQRLGGAAALARIVELFYGLALDDPALAPVFARVDLDALQRHQAHFLGFVLGTDDATVGARMRRAHAGLEITPRQFTTMARHLATALESADVAPPLVHEIAEQVERLRDDIVGR
ncbi:MAG TPA: group 1 truncated hemoglobin [Thermomicrobiales bacterium]|nr:group 1 truncated hemoglobin [Thermomicrobiales bacterium]